VTGYRISRYRAPVDLPLEGGERITLEMFDRLVSGEGAALVDVMPSDGAGYDPATGAWRIVTPRDSIPGAVWLPDVGRGHVDPRLEAAFRTTLQTLAAAASPGGPPRPLILFCQSDCWMAWNAVKRAAGYGLTRLYWYPEGTDGWRDEDRPLARVEPRPVPASDVSR